MYNGYGYCRFYIYETGKVHGVDDPIKTINLSNMVIHRKDSTLQNRKTVEFVNPLTNSLRKKDIGYRIDETITLVSNNFIGTQADYINKESDTGTETEHHKIITLLQYANSDDYYLLYTSHSDVEDVLGSQPLEVVVDVIDNEKLSNDVLGADSDYTGGIEQLTLRVRSVSGNVSPFMPNPPVSPTVLTPADAATVHQFTTFTWEAYEGALKYHLKICSDSSMTTILYDNDEIDGAETSIDVPDSWTDANGNIDSSTIYWTLKVSTDNVTWSLPSAVRSATVYCKAVSLDGTSNYMSSGGYNVSKYRNIQKLEISAWIKPTSNAASQALFYAKPNASDNYRTYVRLSYQSGTGKYKIYWNVNNGSASYITSSVELSYGELAFIVCQFDGTQGTAADRPMIYLNGVEDTSAVISGTFQSTTQNQGDAAVSLFRPDTANTYFKGLCGFLGVKVGSLSTAQEIEDQYNDRKGILMTDQGFNNMYNFEAQLTHNGTLTDEGDDGDVDLTVVNTPSIANFR